MADPAWLLLVGARLAHYVAVTLLFGAAVFPLYAKTGLQGQGIRPLAWAALLTTVAWFLATVAQMTGDIASAFAPDVLLPVLKEMNFGHLAVLRMALAGSVVWAVTTRTAPVTVTILSGLLLASLAGVGHARLEVGLAGLGDMTADGLHLLAAGAWIGGLAPLAILAVSHAGDPVAELAFGQTLRGFSRMGYVAVATLVSTGLFNGWRLVGSMSNLLTTPYGRLLMVKLALFMCMLALAAVNRLWISPALSKPASDTTLWLNRLKRHVAAEQGLALLILAIVSWLGAIEPQPS